MAKIRGFKPDLWTDEDFVEVSAFARLLWLGMWNYACDNGHLPDKSKQIKMRVLPTDDVNCAELLRELEVQGLIERADGWLTIPNLTRHQKPDKRFWVICDRPGCVKPEGNSQREPRSAHGETTTSAPRGHMVGSQRARGDGDGDGEVMVKDGDGEGGADKPPRAKRATPLPEDWQPNEAHLALAVERGVNAGEELEKFRDWAAANGATKKDWDATFRNWLRNARPTNVRQLPTTTDGQGRVVLPPLPPKTPWEGA